jgi:hypothetical protein
MEAKCADLRRPESALRQPDFLAVTKPLAVVDEIQTLGH